MNIIPYGGSSFSAPVNSFFRMQPLAASTKGVGTKSSCIPGSGDKTAWPGGSNSDTNPVKKIRGTNWHSTPVLFLYLLRQIKEALTFCDVENQGSFIYRFNLSIRRYIMRHYWYTNIFDGTCIAAQSVNAKAFLGTINLAVGDANKCQAPSCPCV